MPDLQNIFWQNLRDFLFLLLWVNRDAAKVREVQNWVKKYFCNFNEIDEYILSVAENVVLLVLFIKKIIKQTKYISNMRKGEKFILVEFAYSVLLFMF